MMKKQKPANARVVRVQGLRFSGASGKHDQGTGRQRTRRDAKRVAIRDSYSS